MLTTPTSGNDRGRSFPPARELAPAGDLWNRTARNARAMTMTLDTRLAPSPDAVYRELDGEAVILHLESGQYYGLDPLGTRIWELIGVHPRPRDIAAVLLDEYDVDAERLDAELLDLLTRLAERNLIHVTP